MGLYFALVFSSELTFKYILTNFFLSCLIHFLLLIILCLLVSLQSIFYEHVSSVDFQWLYTRLSYCIPAACM